LENKPSSQKCKLSSTILIIASFVLYLIFSAERLFLPLGPFLLLGIALLSFLLYVVVYFGVKIFITKAVPYRFLIYLIILSFCFVSGSADLYQKTPQQRKANSALLLVLKSLFQVEK